MAKETVKFETPVIIGGLCTNLAQVPRALTKAFVRKKPKYAFLPFQVEKRYLKNTVACMKLMDVMGLVVLGSHSRLVARHLPKLDAAAKRSGRVDLIIRDRKKFVGKDISSTLKKPSVGLFCQTCVEILTASKK